MSTQTTIPKDPIAPTKPTPRRCPICPDLVSELGCYLNFERGTLRDLHEARLAGSDDVDVLEADAAKVRRHIDGLIGIAAMGARR